MISSQLNLRFENLDYSVIKKKNFIPIFVLLLNALIFFSVAIPFIVLWILGVPFEINEQIRQPEEIEYIRFMTIFLGIFLSIATICLIFGLVLLKVEPKEYITIGKDIDFEVFYKIRKDKRNLIFIKGDKGVYYNELSYTMTEISLYSELKEIMSKYLFWIRWNELKEFKIKQKNKRTVLEFLEKTKRTVLKNRYMMPVSNSYLPEKIIEIISNRTGAQKSNLSAYNTYYFTENNIQKQLNLPQKVFNYFYNQD